MKKKLFSALAAASLVLCTSAAVRHFQGVLTNVEYKEQFLIGTIAWFIFATVAVTIGPKRQA